MTATKLLSKYIVAGVTSLDIHGLNTEVVTVYLLLEIMESHIHVHRH